MFSRHKGYKPAGYRYIEKAVDSMHLEKAAEDMFERLDRNLEKEKKLWKQFRDDYDSMIVKSMNELKEMVKGIIKETK